MQHRFLNATFRTGPCWLSILSDVDLIIHVYLRLGIQSVRFIYMAKQTVNQLCDILLGYSNVYISDC